MSIRIPKNQILFNYTSGKEYLVLSTQKEYQGYYYEVNGKFFSGKEFNVSSPEIIKISSNKVDKFKQDPATSTYSKISKVKIPNPEIKSYDTTLKAEQFEAVTQYFISNTTIKPTLIKQVNKETYDSLKNNPIYKRTTLTLYPGTDSGYPSGDLDKAEKELSGIRLYVKPSEPKDIPLVPIVNTSPKPTTQIYSEQTPITGSITDTPKPQDIVPVGPIYEKGAIFVPPLT